jgi:hypothetical protein
MILFGLAACGGESATETGEAPATEPAAGTTPETDTQAEALLESVSLAMSQLENYQADLVLDFTGESEGTVEMQVFVQGNFLSTEGGRPQFKGIVTNSTLPSVPTGALAILGPTTYVYDPASNVVFTGSEGGDAAQPYSDLYTLFLGNQTRAITLMAPGVTAPTIVGEDVSVGDFQTTEVALNPTDTTEMVMAPGAQGTVWIDQDTNLPVKLEYSEDGFGVTWEVTSMSLDELDASVFEPGDTIPDDAASVSAGELGEPIEHDTLDDAAAEVDFTPLMPSYLPSDLPDEPTSIATRQTPLGTILTQGYAVEEAVELEDEFEGLEDANPVQTRGITIEALQSEVGFPDAMAGSESEVSVRGQDATLTTLGDDRVILNWTEDGVIYQISSNGYGEDEVVQVAEGLE